MKAVYYKLRFLTCLNLSFFIFHTVHALDYASLQKAQALIREAKRDNTELLDKIASEKKALLEKLDHERRQVRESQTRLDERVLKIKSLELEIGELKQLHSQQSFEVVHLKQNIHRAGEELHGILKASLLQHRHPERLEKLGRTLTQSPYPEVAKTILKLSHAEIADAGRLLSFNTKVTDTQSRESEAQVLMAGKMQAWYKSAEEIGLLQAGDKQLHAIKDSPSSQKLAAIFNGGAVETLPVDLSSGGALLVRDSEWNFQTWFRSGGIMSWPISLCGIVVLCLALLRGLSLSSISRHTQLLSREIHRAEGAFAQLAKNNPAPLARVIAAGLPHSDNETREKVMQECLNEEIPELEKHLSLISLIAATAPLLGLLGTVTGMISTFDIISLFGNSDARLMSGGISEALVSTQMGLIVAVPALFIHNFLMNRVDTIVDDTQAGANAAHRSLENTKGNVDA